MAIKNSMQDLLNIKFLSFDANRVTACMQIDARTCQSLGLLNGGASLAFAEICAGEASTWILGKQGGYAVGVEVSASHLRALACGHTLHATAVPLRLGKKLHVWEVRLEDERRNLISIARVTNAVVSPKISEKPCKTLKLEHAVDVLLAKREEFALCFKPDGSFKAFLGSGHKRYFELAPFAASQQALRVRIFDDNPIDCPFKLQEKFTNIKAGTASAPSSPFKFGKPADFARYQEVFMRYLETLNNGDYEKIVLSRFKTACCKSSAGQMFDKLRKLYPDSFCYIAYSKACGLWLGASPELLGSKDPGSYKTMALAGTAGEDEIKSLGIDWSEKNLKEHELVVSHIASVLAPAASLIKIGEPTTLKAGALRHLCTNFEFFLRDSVNALELIGKLEPTPAVCGLPIKKALKFIQDNEGYDRLYYCGHVGEVNADNDFSLWVNLRCMHLDGDKARLFAGGGIMPQSELHAEWEESCRKFKIMEAVL